MTRDPYTPDALIETFKKSLEDGTSVQITGGAFKWPEPPAVTTLTKPAREDGTCIKCDGWGYDDDYVVLDDEEYWTSIPCSLCEGTGDAVDKPENQ